MRSQNVFILIVGIFAGAIAAISQDDQNSVVNAHNWYRANVEPAASDMKYMTWHEGAAKLAQDWANSCQRLTHNKPVDRYYGSCGQNILVSTAPVSWGQMVKSWYDEVKDFTYGGNNQFYATGHYTQVVWADSHKVGCGVAYCQDSQGKFYNYVCNYCPAGNYQDRLNRPYKRGSRCGSCPNSCYYGLCY